LKLTPGQEEAQPYFLGTVPTKSLELKITLALQARVNLLLLGCRVSIVCRCQLVERGPLLGSAGGHAGCCPGRLRQRNPHNLNTVLFHVPPTLMVTQSSYAKTVSRRNVGLGP
jgi:hypothetical protein